MRHLLRAWVAYAQIQVPGYVLLTFRQLDLSGYGRDGTMASSMVRTPQNNQQVIVANRG
jgi:hypothetical protein